MKLSAFPAILALAAVSACVPAFAQTPPDQARTAHHDTEFLKTANQISVDEIDMARIALSSDDPDVKAFAQKMITDHTQLLDDMKPFDMEAGLTIPDHSDASTLAEEAKLKILTGKTFDKAYIKEMVQGHHKAVELFIAEERSTGYPDFKTAVTSATQVITGHLEQANSIAKKLGVPTAPVPKA